VDVGFYFYYSSLVFRAGFDQNCLFTGTEALAAITPVRTVTGNVTINRFPPIRRGCYMESIDAILDSGVNRTISSYNANVVNCYNATGSLVRFNKNILLYIEIRSSLLQRWRIFYLFKSSLCRQAAAGEFFA
jgi:hypothetical protein